MAGEPGRNRSSGREFSIGPAPTMWRGAMRLVGLLSKDASSDVMETIRPESFPPAHQITTKPSSNCTAVAPADPFPISDL